MVPKMMEKMPFADWKEWATRRPEWVRGDMRVAFEKYVERKWKDTLNIAAAEHNGWEAGGGRSERGQVERPSVEKHQADKVGGGREEGHQDHWAGQRCDVGYVGYRL